MIVRVIVQYQLVFDRCHAWFIEYLLLILLNEVFTGELLPAVFVQTKCSEVCAKMKGNNFPVKTEQMSK